jgi:hypothetical protein
MINELNIELDRLRANGKFIKSIIEILVEK